MRVASSYFVLPSLTMHKVLLKCPPPLGGQSRKLPYLVSGLRPCRCQRPFQGLSCSLRRGQPAVPLRCLEGGLLELRLKRRQAGL